MVIFELLHPGIWGKKDKNDPAIWNSECAAVQQYANNRLIGKQ